MSEELSTIERAWAEKMQGCAPGECLEAPAILEVATKGRGARNYAGRMAHIAVCPTCRSTLKLVKSAEAARPARSWLPVFGGRGYVLALSAAAATLAIMLLTGVLDFGSRSAPGRGALTHNEAPAPRNGTNKPTSPKNFVPNRDLVANNDAPPRVPAPRRHFRKHLPRSLEVPRNPAPIPSPEHYARNERASGLLEGEVFANVIEGEVGSENVVSGNVEPPTTVEGNVVKKSPPSKGGELAP